MLVSRLFLIDFSSTATAGISRISRYCCVSSSPFCVRDSELSFSGVTRAALEMSRLEPTYARGEKFLVHLERYIFVII
jgi:hypothetical protein